MRRNAVGQAWSNGMAEGMMISGCQGANRGGGPGSARFVCRISFVSSGSRPNALSLSLS